MARPERSPRLSALGQERLQPIPGLDGALVLATLRDAGVPVDEEVQVMDGIGRFAWATDPEGNRFELWEPAPEALRESP
jgi:hypothetical protein